MRALLIGYAHCSTDQQDLTAQREGLTALGVAVTRIYVDDGLTGTDPWAANGIVVLNPTTTGVSRVTAFHHDPTLVVMFGFPEVLTD